MVYAIDHEAAVAQRGEHVMSETKREGLKAKFWAHVPESIEGYSDRIEVLLMR